MYVSLVLHLHHAERQVHYPGWEDKWDEWVPRDRLRWGNERLAAALEGIAPRKGDSVEMWCQGLHVPGAWLEAVVHGVEKGRLYLGEVRRSDTLIAGKNNPVVSVLLSCILVENIRPFSPLFLLLD